MQRFELAGAPSRFWEIWQEQLRVRLRWGEQGTAGQGFERTFETETEAASYAARQIQGQLARGYVEVVLQGPEPEGEVVREQRFEWSRDRTFRLLSQRGRVVTWQGGAMGLDGAPVPDPSQVFSRRYPSVVEASARYGDLIATFEHDGGRSLGAATRDHANPALEALCDASPDDPAPWAVYADWLIAHGDPRGEIAALDLAGNSDTARQLLAEHYGHLCGVDERQIALELRHGFPVAATLTLDHDAPGRVPNRPQGTLVLADLTRRFLAAPISRFVTSLRFGLAHPEPHANDWAPTLEAVLRSDRGADVREIRFDIGSWVCPLEEITFGDFSRVWHGLESLQLFHLRSGAGGTLGAIALPNLRTFIRESCSLRASEVEAIASADWPNLEHLEIWTGSTIDGGTVALRHLVPILAGRGLPALRHLGIVNSDLAEELVPALARSTLLGQLDSLDLSRGAMARADALVEHAGAFRHLASLDLRKNVLAPDEIVRIRAVLDNVITTDQRDAHERAARVASPDE